MIVFDKLIGGTGLAELLTQKYLTRVSPAGHVRSILIYGQTDLIKSIATADKRKHETMNNIFDVNILFISTAVLLTCLTNGDGWAGERSGVICEGDLKGVFPVWPDELIVERFGVETALASDEVST